MPLARSRREEIVRLLDTAEAAVARDLGMGWRIHWTDDQMVLQRHARVALLMAFTALLMVIRREQERAPATIAPKRKPRRRVVVGTEPFGAFLPMPFMPEPPRLPIRQPDEPRAPLPEPVLWHIPSKSFLARAESAARAAPPSPPLPARGSVPAGGWSDEAATNSRGTSSSTGDDGRGLEEPRKTLRQTYPRIRNP